MQLLQASFVCFGDMPSVGPSLAGSGWVAGACAHKAFSCQIRLLHEGEHVWNWVQAAETTGQAAVPTEPEAAQALLGPKGSLGLGEKYTSAAFLSKDAFGLKSFPEQSFPLQNAAPRIDFLPLT